MAHPDQRRTMRGATERMISTVSSMDAADTQFGYRQVMGALLSLTVAL